MPIEFECSECESYLRTADEKAGLRIRCPHCQTPLWVPHQDSSEGFHSPPAPFVETLNSDWEIRQHHDVPKTEETLTNGVQVSDIGRVTLRGILEDTWTIYTANIGLCLFASFVDMVAMALAVVLSFVLGWLIMFVFVGQNGGMAGPLAAFFVVVLGMTVTYSAITVGNFRYYLSLVRGSPAGHRAWLVSDSAIGHLIGGWLIFWMLVWTGLVMGLVPGLLAMIFLWPFAAFIVDRRVSAPVAFRDSYLVTTKNFGPALGVFFLHLLLLGAAMFSIIGFVVAAPLAAILHSVAYLHLTGEQNLRPAAIPLVPAEMLTPEHLTPEGRMD